MRTIQGLHGGVLLSLLGALAGCELIADIGDPTLRKPDAGTGGQGGSGGTTTTSTSSSSTSSSSTTSSSSSSTGGTGGAAPTCTDDAKNGNETGKDCGGGMCPPCPIGEGCIVGTDCESNACSAGTCVPGGCSDSIQNGTETDIDCGGLTCAACGNGKMCSVNSDCASGNCVANVCVPPSCAGGGAGLSDCGPTANESCCTSLPVPGGTFKRSYDGVTFTDASYPATVSGFGLDKYEVTVGRFRQFVAAWVGGWRPAAGAGKHTHLNGGNGLAATSGGYEAGWDTSWNSNLPTSASVWNNASYLACNSTYATWTASPGSNENRPITCVNWYSAYAFCIWDGGFLPSEAEWNYAAAGGNEQRVYPWSTPPNSSMIDCSHANYSNGTVCSPGGMNNVGSESAQGDGRWGHTDLAGNVWELLLDAYTQPYGTMCTDCVHVLPDSDRVRRGGGSFNDASYLLTAQRSSHAPASNNTTTGLRCAGML